MLRQSRRLVGAVGLVVAQLVLAAAAHAACPADKFEVVGRVLDNDPVSPHPVPCCYLWVYVYNASGSPWARVETETRSDGTFSACVPCLPMGGAGTVTVQPTCCNAVVDPIDIAGCPPSPVDFGDIACVGSPVTYHTLLQGRVLCRSGAFTEPVADCSILIASDPSQPNHFEIVTRTDANGAWEECVPCNPSDPGTSLPLTVTAQCCGISRQVSIDHCPLRVQVPTFTCDDCPVPPCDKPRDVEIVGRVTCEGPSGNTPIADCKVDLSVQACGSNSTYTVTTDADGRYRTCVPCPGDAGCALWSITATPRCCSASAIHTVEGCPSHVDVEEVVCPRPPSGDCMSGTSCDAGSTLVHGHVKCVNPMMGPPLPFAGCDVRIEGPRGCSAPPVIVATDADGYYEACFTCSCNVIIVTATCCGSVNQQQAGRCPADMTFDLVCPTCPGTESRSCPPPDSVKVSGVVTCREGGHSWPVAGCEILLVGRDAGGNEVSTAATVTDGEGLYDACVECGPGLASVVARATCCDADSVTPVAGCPKEATLAPIECRDCRPCPLGMTRVEGRVHCRRGGPVEGCVVRLTVTTCTGVEVYRTLTDDHGRYKLCVPCPCKSSPGITAYAECCDGQQTAPNKGCKKTTPIKTIECRDRCRR